MSEKVLHEWRHDSPSLRPIRIIERDGELLLQRLYGNGKWVDVRDNIDIDTMEIARLAAENERLRKWVVKAADTLREWTRGLDLDP